MRKTPSVPVLFGLVAASGCLLYDSAYASVLWDGDASNGTGVFQSLNIENNPGVIDVVNDSTYGQVFRFICYDPATNIKTRTEGSHMAGFQPVAGSTYYFGWRHKWGPLPTACGKWQVLEQIHLAGSGATGGPVPFGLHVDGCDANMHFQYQDAAGTPHDFLVLPFPLNSWHAFVYHEKWSESESDGYVEFWYDGVMKTLANGSTRYPSAWCFPNSTSYWKWGIYRSGSGGMIGTAYAYLQGAAAGTTYADVDPTGGNPFSGYYKFVDHNSGKVPAVKGAATTNGAPVILWSFGSSQNDQWQFVATDSGYYNIVNRKSGKSMAVQSASTADGAAIIQWTFGSAQNDQWKPIDAGGGYFNLQNRHSGLMLDVKGAATTNGTPFQQFHANGGDNQEFQFISTP